MGSKYKENLCVTVDRYIKEWIDKHSVNTKKSKLVNQILGQYIKNAMENERVHIPRQYHLCEMSYQNGNGNLDSDIEGVWNEERGVWEYRCSNCGWFSIKKPRKY